MGGTEKVTFEVITSLRSSIRRRWIWIFNPRYIIEQLRKREGSCKDCGAICCKRTRPCPFLKNCKCTIYNKRIPFQCWVFPIDKKDIELAGVSDVCQFKFKM